MKRKHKILIIDDDENWLYTLKAILKSTYDLTLISDYNLAYDLVLSNNYSLVIIDQKLPNGITGIEVLTKLRIHKPSIAAIILTGYASIDDAVRSMRVGVVDYISKGTENLDEVLKHRIKENLRNVINEDIKAVILQGESEKLEFKSSARWDIRENRLNKELSKAIVKTVAAFLNSYKGGRLIIGVSNEQNIVGLEQDYKTLKTGQSRDIFENFLTSLILDACGRDCSPYLNVTFRVIDFKDICIVELTPSPRPIFIKEDNGDNFYIRAGNTSKPLSHEDTLQFCKNRWKRKY